MMRMALARVAAPILVLLVLGACSRAPSAQATPGHPEFSGWWSWKVEPGRFPSPFLGAPFHPQFGQAFASMAAAYDSANMPDPVALGARPEYCQLPSFAGFNGGFETSIEFLATPGRMNIANEAGMFRRVYLDKELPVEPDPTRHGVSVGRWEDSTLVVETTGLRPDNVLPLAGFPVGKNVHVVERVSLADPDTLVIDLTMTAPDLFTEPFMTRFEYRRDVGHEFHEYSVCEQDDRSLDPATSRQRFDLTPPEDLPPPPAD